jgi:hypothetical protein
MNAKYKSKYKVDFSSDFIFSFEWKPSNPETLDGTDFDLKFLVESDTDSTKTNAFKISNIPSQYTVKESLEYSLKQCNRASDEFLTYYDDNLVIFNNNVYSELKTTDTSNVKNFYNINDKVYVLTDKYSFKTNSSNYIKRINEKNDKGYYIRPVEVKKFENSSVTETKYFTDFENKFDASLSKTYRIIVSSKARFISVWAKENGKFEQIKTFSYLNPIEKGFIKLTLDSDMELSDLRFTFFEADVE